MQFTLLRLVAISLSLPWAFRPRRHLSLALMVIVFGAMAAAMASGFGPQSAMVSGLLASICLGEQALHSPGTAAVRCMITASRLHRAPGCCA